MKLQFLLSLALVFFISTSSQAADNCLETNKIEPPSEDGLALSAIMRVQKDGWLPVKNKKLVQDFDQNRKRDFAYLLKKDNQLRVYVIWDGDRIMEAQCHSDLVGPTSITEFVDDPCKLQFETFKEKNEMGLLIRTHETFTYKYLCRKSVGGRIWHNIGTPD